MDAVADAGEAGVVAVGAAAAGGGGADVLVAAAGAGDLPGEVVVAVAGGALGLRVGALGRYGGGALPGRAVDQGLVGVLDIDVAVGDVPGVGGVGQDPGDGVPGPGLAGAVADAPAVQLGGDGPGAQALVGVEPEDLLQVRCFLGVRDELVRVAVNPVAVRAGAAGPFSLGGLCGHAPGDTVDDGLPLELGEHAEELDEHPADGGRGVERLGRRHERHPGAVQLGEQGQQVGQAAGESVERARRVARRTAPPARPAGRAAGRGGRWWRRRRRRCTSRPESTLPGRRCS